MVFLLLHIKD